MIASIDNLTINGETFSVEEMSRHQSEHSLLWRKYVELFGAMSFEVSLAEFLEEWFDGRDVLKVHTSGSTGRPKELWVEKRRMLNSASMTISFLGLGRGDSALLCMPLAYIAGKMVVVRAMVAGLNLIPVQPSGHPVRGLNKAPYFAAMTPMQVWNILNSEDPGEALCLRGIQELIIGGGAIDDKLADMLKAFPNRVWSTYGMTETLSHIALRRLSGPQTSELYTPFADVVLSQDPDGALIIDAPSVNPEILHTNDLVELNGNGQFRVLGRKDNTINTGGVKVQIEEVEALLRAHLDCPFMVVPAPDPKFGQIIVLLVEMDFPDSGCVILDDTSINSAIRSLPKYWQPKKVFATKHLPLTGTGKPDRASAILIISR